MREVEFCTVASLPEDYAGQLVKVHGVVTFGFEQSTLTSNCPPYEWWLAAPDQSGRVFDKPRAGERVVLGVSLREFQEWSKAGLLADPEALPWETAEAAEPVVVVRNRRWRRLWKIDCPTPATLIGRIDHLPGPGFIATDPRHGFLWQSSSYGHMDWYPVRFVVTEVVSLGRGENCKKK